AEKAGKTPQQFVADIAAAAGVFYGVQTLRQWIAPGGRTSAVSIADWPALRYRGFSVDVSRGPIPTDAQLERLIRTAAEFKLNMLSLYMEHVFRYRHMSLVAPEGGEFTPEQARRLSEYTRRYHIELVPQQQTFGHLHHMLKFERYAELAEVPHGAVITPASPATYQWIEQTCRQLAAAFPGTFLHIGSDETWELGQGRSRPEAERDGVGRLYLRHMQRVAEMLQPLGRRLMFWGDIALRHAELIPELPRDLVAMTWTYDPRESFNDYIEPFRKAGFAYFVCPGLNNWNRIFPNVSNALANIAGFVRDGKRAGALGMFNTHWADDGEALLNQNWYGILYSAAAAWQQQEPSPEEFGAAFDWAFYRNSDQTFASVIQRLDHVHRILQQAGVGDASDRLFWLDPFAPAGAALAARVEPVASPIRLAAEQALAALEAGEHKALRHRDTLLALRLAATRLDYLGMKAQFARRLADIYRESLAARAPRNFGRINGTNGMLQDLRDYATQLRDLYRRAWLAENRPYWLDNVLVRYDDEALLWTRRIRLFTDAVQQYSLWQRLPPPEELGLHLP
ncbi:MAG: family 20 glycosylhydrolase, partial [Bryobacteraceae bacterium]